MKNKKIQKRKYEELELKKDIAQALTVIAYSTRPQNIQISKTEIKSITNLQKYIGENIININKLHEENQQKNRNDTIITNIHKNCENYNNKKDYCLKFFEENINSKYKKCKEKTTFNDQKLQKKWSN